MVIRTSVAKQLVTTAICTRLSSSNWALQLSSQKPPATGHSNSPQPQAHGQQNLQSSLSNWTLPGLPQPKLRLTLVICTRVPKHSPIRYITPAWTPGCQYSGYEEWQVSSSIPGAIASGSITRTRFPLQESQVLACSLHGSRPPPRLKLGFSPSVYSALDWIPVADRSLGDTSLPSAAHAAQATGFSQCLVKAQRVGRRLSAQVCLCGY